MVDYSVRKKPKFFYSNPTNDSTKMKKQELIHVHALMNEIQSEFDENDVDVDVSDYENLGVKSTSIHKSLDDHEEAVLTLAEDLAESVEAGTETEMVRL